MRSSLKMESALQNYCKTGEITTRTENNKYLKLSYVGTGNIISKKWNVKIYKSGSVVTTDTKILKDIIDGNIKAPDKNLKLIQIDDAGFGFPLCGVMIGVYDGRRIWTDTVSVQFFQGTSYEIRQYLDDYTQKGLKILQKLETTPETHRIEICSGFINKKLKNRLRDLKYDVRIVDITGPLQDDLELLFKRHIAQETDGGVLAYDPKELPDKSMIGKKYYEVVRWGRKNAPHLLKTGWKALQNK